MVWPADVWLAQDTELGTFNTQFHDNLQRRSIYLKFFFSSCTFLCAKLPNSNIVKCECVKKSQEGEKDVFVLSATADLEGCVVTHSTLENGKRKCNN